MKYLLLLILTPLLLFGCGGGDDDGNTSTPTVTPSAKDDSAPSLSLVARKGQDFSTNYEVAFDVNLPTADTTFVMVYTDYVLDPVTGLNVPLNNSKLISASFDNGQFSGELNLGKHVDDVFVQVLSTSDDPNESFTRIVPTGPGIPVVIN